MAEYSKSKHDLGILRQDGTTTVGLMVHREKNVPQYQEKIREALSEQRATGEPGYGWFDPGSDLPIIQDDWRDGISQEIFDPADPKKYLSATNMDLRFDGTAIAGPKATAVTKPTTPSAPTIVNADMELDSDWTGGAWSAAFYHTGARSWRVKSNSSTDRAYQDITTYHPSLAYTFQCWAYKDAATAATVKIGIDDGLSETLSSAVSANDTWEQLSVTKTLAPNCTQLRLVLYTTTVTGSDMYGYFDDATISIAAITVGVSSVAADYNGGRYSNFGTVLTKLNSGGTKFDFVHNFPSTISALEPHKDGFLYIGQEGSTVIEDCEDAWTDGSATGSLDTSDYKVGSGSVKFVCAAGMSAGDLVATEAITSTNLQTRTGIKLWIKCSIATSAADLQFLLDDTAACASPLETLDIPALVANTWTRVYIKLANPETDLAIISVGLKYTVDIGACTIWIDDVELEDLFFYMSSGNTCTQSTHASGFAKFFKTNGTTLWKALMPNELKSSTNPTGAAAADWSAATLVGTPAYDITGMVSQDNVLYVMKADRPFYIDSGGTPEVLVDDTVSLTTSYSGKNAITWHGELFMPWGTASLLRYTKDGNPEWIDPALYCVNLGNYDGRVFALAGGDQWLYALIDNSTSVEVLAGREEARGWIWHPIATITLTGCEAAFVSSIYNKRLWITTTDSSENVYFIDLYLNYGDVVNDANKNFQTDGEFITPWHFAHFKSDNKAFIKLTLHLEDTKFNSLYYEAHYQVFGHSTWKDIGDFQVSPFSTIYLPVLTSGTYIIEGSASTKQVGVAIRFKFVCKTDSVTATPKLRGYDCRAILAPKRNLVIDTVVKCADNTELRDKLLEKNQQATIKATLEEALKNAVWPVTIYDNIDGLNTTRYVKFQPVDPFSWVIADEDNRTIERLYHLRMEEIKLS